MKASEFLPKSDVRQLLKARKPEVNRVVHPHARYNQLGRITCILCGVQLKSEFAWNAHVLSRTHKEKEHRDMHVSLKRASAGPVREADQDIKLPRQSESLVKPTDSQVVGAVAPKPRLVGDKNPAEKSREPTPSSKLPEGFFDDKYKDAKVRNVPYKDKLAEEVELFQRELVALEKESEEIDEKDSELMLAVRELDEIDVQLQKWKRIEELQIEKETLEEKIKPALTAPKEVPLPNFKVKVEPHSSVSDDTSDEEFYDFRKKNTV